MLRILLFILLLLPASLLAQEFYLIGGYGGGLTEMPVTEGIMSRYNNGNPFITEYFQEINSMGGPHGGLGLYTGPLQIEVKYIRQGITRSATGFEPGVGVVGSDLRLSYQHLNFALGVRPFDNNYLSLGMSANFGNYKVRYGENGGLAVITRRFAMGNDFFADLMLLNKKPLMLKVRPFFRLLYWRAPLAGLEAAVNDQDLESLERSAYLENFNLVGMQFSLMYLWGN